MQPVFTCFTENLNYALGWMVIHSLWQATAIAIISGIAALLVRKKSPELRYWIHNAALLSVLVAAIVTFCLYFDFSKELGQTIFVPEKVEATANGLQVAQAEIRNPTSEIGSPLSMEGLRMYFNRNIYLIVTIWALGVALFMLKLLGGISYVYYLRSKLNFPADEYWLEMVEKLGEKAGVKRSMELVESALVRSPLVVGYLKPMILFPIGAINKLNPQEVEAILSHEIAHVLRNDYVFNIIQSVIEALFYFHPAVWWISANIRAERENCCDDVAIALCGNSMTYAKALVSLQEMAHYCSPQLAMAFAGQRKNQLLFRVQRILKQPNNKANVMEKLIATCLLLIMMVALSFGGNRWNNDNFVDTNTLKDNAASLTELESNANNAATLPPVVLSKHFIKYSVNGILDSFPVGKEVADGNYNYADNKYQAKLTVKDHFVVKLNINGSEIPANEIKNHRGFINDIIMRSAAPPQYNDDNQPVIATNPDVIPQTTVTPMPTFSESNGDMVVSDGQGGQTVISHKEDGNTVQTVTTTHANGMRSITKTYKNGETISETFDKNGRRITKNTAGGMNNNWNQSADVPTPPPPPDVPDDENRAERINDLKEELNDLKQEINECECQTNVEFRKKLASKIDKVLDGLNKGLSENEAKAEFKNIQRTWENGECGDNAADNNGNIGYGSTKGTKGNKNSNTGNGGSVNSNSDTWKGWNTNADAQNNVQKQKEFDLKQQEKAQKAAEIAQKDAERYNGNVRNQASRADDKAKSKAMNRLFVDLKNAGFVMLNKRCTVAFSNNHLEVNGKNLTDNLVFALIKGDFQKILGKATYSISFSGSITDLSDEGISMNGSLNTSINKE